MIKSTRLACVLAILAATVASSSAFAANVFFDDFNTENNGIGQTNYSSLKNWTITSGSVDLIGNGLYDFQPGNGLYLDLDGSSSAAGTLQSKEALALAAGTYELSFALAGSQCGQSPSDSVTVQVNLGDLFSKTIVLAYNEPFQTYTSRFTVAQPTSVTLSFAATGGDNMGLLLDNVGVATAVPVPAAGWAGMALMGGIGTIRALRRRMAR